MKAELLPRKTSRRTRKTISFERSRMFFEQRMITSSPPSVHGLKQLMVRDAIYPWRRGLTGNVRK